MLKYTGYESSAALVNQAKTTLAGHNNATVLLAEPMSATPAASDLVISRSYLSTLSYADIRLAITRFSTYPCKFFALGSFAHKSSDNRDIKTGANFLINLEKDPFNMSPADTSPEGANGNRLFMIYTSDQMKGYIKSNAFWTGGQTS